VPIAAKVQILDHIVPGVKSHLFAFARVGYHNYLTTNHNCQLSNGMRSLRVLPPIPVGYDEEVRAGDAPLGPNVTAAWRIGSNGQQQTFTE